MAPYVEKHFTQEVLGQGFIVYETQQPPINPHPIPCEERSHSRLVACSDPSGQRFIGRTFTSRCPLSRRGGPSCADANRSHWRLPLYPLRSAEIDRSEEHTSELQSLRHLVC